MTRTAVIDSTSPRDATIPPPDVLRAALEGLPIGVLLVSHDGTIVHTNSELERLFGYASGELVGRSVDVLLPRGVRKAPEQAGQEEAHEPEPGALATGRELLGRREDGSELPVEVRVTPVAIGDTTFVLTAVVDIRERQRLQLQVSALRDERIQFEALVAELAAEFVNRRPADADRTIEEALGRLARILDLDRSVIMRLEENGDLVITHQWSRPGLVPPPPRIAAAKEFPFHLEQIRSGQVVSFAALDEVPDEADRASAHRFETKSAVTLPLHANARTWGAFCFTAAREPRTWAPELINRFRVVASLFANVIARKEADEALGVVVAESATLRERLRDENAYLRRELKGVTGDSAIVGHSRAIRRVIQQVREVAATDSPVLLIGEAGTGKTRIATWIHGLSSRRERTMVRMNCTTLSAATIDNELSGDEYGWYGEGESDAQRIGRLELAHKSTLLLDEIGDLPRDAQASLLRVLQNKRTQPVGSTTAVALDIRLIATTRKDLGRCVEEGTFREDLYFLLNLVPIQVPPLRERSEDIPLLVWSFVDELSESLGKSIDTIDKASMAALERYVWPGNAREVRNVVERAIIVGGGRHLRIALPGRPSAPRRSEALAAVERDHISAVLEACGGRVEGKRGAAARLGLTTRSLALKMRKLGLSRRG